MFTVNEKSGGVKIEISISSENLNSVIEFLSNSITSQLASYLKNLPAGDSKTNETEKIYYSAKDIAELLSYKTVQTVYQRHYKNELPAPAPGRRLIWKVKDITAWIEAGQPTNWEAHLLEKKTENFINSKKTRTRF